MAYKKTVPVVDSKSVDDIVGSAVSKPAVSDVKPVVQAVPQVVSQPAVTEPAFSGFRYPRVDTTPTQEVSGILDIQPEGHGFLRPKFIPSSRDVYISQSQIRRFLLRP